jgi:RNA polymerase sigma-70 factor, ECF subfamily
LDDLSLAERLAARDPHAMEELVHCYHSDVYRFLRHLTRRIEDAEDLAQQTLLRAVNGASRFDGRAPMRAWLMGIAFREFGRWRRRRLWLPLLADRPNPDDPFRDVVEAEALLKAIGDLSSLTRGVFLLHHVQDLSILEISAALGVPEGTVKSRLHAARAHLRILLKEEETYVIEPIQP